MKSITFRPLRRIKKTGKITVASYMQWRKVLTADYNKFNLVIDDEYKKLPKDEYVYNHEGELLYFFTYNPADIPVFQCDLLFDLEQTRAKNKYFGILWEHGSHVCYNMPGTDCNGVPCFAHWDENRITQEDVWNFYGPDQFEPLTVETVTKWFGWFLFQLQNSYLQIGK